MPPFSAPQPATVRPPRRPSRLTPYQQELSAMATAYVMGLYATAEAHSLRAGELACTLTEELAAEELVKMCRLKEGAQ